jgi:hypothetical protein
MSRTVARNAFSHPITHILDERIAFPDYRNPYYLLLLRILANFVHGS